jgi:hypothetical protein
MEEQICILHTLHELGCVSQFFFHFVEIDHVQSETQLPQLQKWCGSFIKDLHYNIYCCDATSLASMLPTHTAAIMMFYTFISGPLTYVDIGLAAVNLRALWLISFKENLAHLTSSKLTGMHGGLLKPAQLGDEVIDFGTVKSGTKTCKWIFLSPSLHKSCSLILSLPSSPSAHQLKGVRVEALDLSKLHNASYDKFAHAVLSDRDALSERLFNQQGPSRSFIYRVETLGVALHFNGYISDKDEAFTFSCENIAEVYRKSSYVLNRHDQTEREEFLKNLELSPRLVEQGSRTYYHGDEYLSL